MSHNSNQNWIARTAFIFGVVALITPAMSMPNFTTLSIGSLQRRGGGGGHSGGGNRGGGNPGQQQSQQSHARREQVRTNNFVPRNNGPQPGSQPGRTSNPGFPGRPGNPAAQPSRPGSGPGQPRSGGYRRPGVPPTQRVQSERHFTKTAQGRVYDNGVRLRKGVRIAAWQKPYFPHGYAHFPFYRPSFVSGQCFVSPFAVYFGVCCPFIDVSVCHVYPPAQVYVDIPVYNGNTCEGYPAYSDENYFDRQDLDSVEPGLANAVDELTETFQNGNVDALVSLIDPNVSIAMYARGHYKYSLNSNDFVDLTRDAVHSLQTVQFNLNYLHQRAPGIFCASGTQTYRAPDGSTRTVYVSYVLQDFGGEWTLTEVSTAPDILRKLY
jgi:hypothetical protein